MFLLKEWQEDHYGPILTNKTLILTHGGNCLQLTFYSKGKIKPLEVLGKDTEGTLIQFFGRLVSEDQPDQSKAEEVICSLYVMKGNVKYVNKARHVKLCQMTGKMDKVLVSLCYMGLFLLGKGNTST